MSHSTIPTRVSHYSVLRSEGEAVKGVEGGRERVGGMEERKGEERRERWRKTKG